MQQGSFDNQYILNNFGERILHAVNGSTFNILGSTAFYKNHFDEYFQAPEHFFIIIGTDGGLLPKYINDSEIPPGTIYLFVELDSIFATIQSELNSVELNENIFITSQENWLELAVELGLPKYVSLEQVSCCKSVGALDCNTPTYRKMAEEVEHNYYQFVWRARINFSGFFFIEEQLKNIADNKVPAICLNQAFANQTAIILAGGPSLDQHIDWVKQHRDDLLVVAVSRISRRLLQADLEPDIVVAIDPTEKMYDVSKECLLFESKPLLITAYHVVAKLLSVWSGDHVYLGARSPWESEFNLNNWRVVGPTVTNTAIDVLINMGVARILLTGVDLCFSEAGYSHAKGSTEFAGGPNLSFIGQQVEMYNGRIAQTDPAFFTAISNLDQQAIQAKQHNCEIINLSQSAAKVANIPYKDIQDIQLKEAPERASVTIREHLNSFRLAFPGPSNNMLLKELEEVNKQLQEIITISSKALEFNQKINPKENSKQNLLISKINKLEEKLNKKHASLLGIIKDYQYKDFVNIYRPKHGKEWTLSEIKTATEVYLQGYVTGAKALQKVVFNTRRRILTRLAETAKRVNISDLIKGWEAHGTLGRAKLWLDNNADRFAVLSKEQQQQILDLIAKNEFDLQKAQPAKKVDLNNYAAIRNIQYKLYQFYIEHNKLGLESFIEQLTQFAPERKSLNFLARAYLAELNEDYTSALDYYYKVSENEKQQANTLLELALNHLASLLIKLNDAENSLFALECLTHLSAAYMPQFAELLTLLEQVESATEVYQDYLAICPNDVLAKYKLGLLYQNQNQTDKAKTLLETVREQAGLSTDNRTTN